MIDANPYFHEMSDWQAVGFNDVWQSCTSSLFNSIKQDFFSILSGSPLIHHVWSRWKFYDPGWSMEEKLMSLAEQKFWVDYDTTLGPSPGWLGWVPECDADTPPSKQQELKAMTLIACHFKHVTYDSSFALKRSSWLFPRPARNFQIARTAKTWSGSWRSCWTTTLQVFQNLAPMMIMMELVQMHISCARPSRRGVFFVACSGGEFQPVTTCLFQETFWWHFWGPAFHYAGTGAYLVKAGGVFGNVGDSPTPIFSMDLALLCSMLCPLLIRSRLLQSHLQNAGVERSLNFRPPSK